MPGSQIPFAVPRQYSLCQARHLLWALGAALLGLACSTGLDQNACDFVDVDLKVLHSPQLTFTWTPSRCGAFELAVTEGTPIKWLTATQGAVNGLHPPILYGRRPDGGIDPSALPLTPGIPYFVILRRADATRTTVLSDTVIFTYSPPD